MPIYPSIESNPAQAGLAQMLVNLQRQGAEQTARVGPMLGEGLQNLLMGFQREGDLGRQREFAAGEARKQRDFERRQAQDRYSVTGARQRRTEAEQKRQFDIAQKGDVENRLMTRLGVLYGIQERFTSSGQPVPPGLSAQIAAIEAKIGGVKPPTSTTTTEAAPVAGDLPVNAPPGSTLAEVLGHSEKRKAAAQEQERQLQQRAAPVAGGLKPVVTEVLGAPAATGGSITERSAQKAMEERKIDDIVGFLSRTLASKGGADKIMVPPGMFRTSGETPATTAGIQMQKIVSDYASGITDEDELVRRAMPMRDPAASVYGGMKGPMWDRRPDPAAKPAEEQALRAFARYIIRSYPRKP